MSSTITIPIGSEVKFASLPPDHLVIVAPPGIKADIDLLTKPGLVGVFTHDRGVSWPDDAGCRWATQYLAVGSAIVLEFSRLADAQACRDRLLRLVSSPSTEAPA